MSLPEASTVAPPQSGKTGAASSGGGSEAASPADSVPAEYPPLSLPFPNSIVGDELDEISMVVQQMAEQVSTLPPDAAPSEVLQILEVASTLVSEVVPDPVDPSEAEGQLGAKAIEYDRYFRVTRVAGVTDVLLAKALIDGYVAVLEELDLDNTLVPVEVNLLHAGFRNAFYVLAGGFGGAK